MSANEAGHNGSKSTQIEAALRLSEERFRQVIEASPTALIMVNRRGLIEMVNAEAEKVFGYQREELLGQPLEMLVPKNFSAAHPSLREMFYKEPTQRRMGAGRDLYALRKDQSEFPVEIGLNPIETPEGTLVLSAIVDITDRKQREQRIQAALKEKDVLLREIHHRVKNNLQIIDSLLNLQAARIGDQQVQEMLRESQNRVRSMALIHQTLYQSNDFSGVDFGHFLDSLVKTLASSYGIEAERIQFVVESAEFTLPLDIAIPCGLAVNELISNAIKHAFPDGRSGQVCIALKLDSEETVMVSVGDNGVGLPKELDYATTQTLGLQLVNLLADQIGGALSQQPGPGANFVLKFPRSRDS